MNLDELIAAVNEQAGAVASMRTFVVGLEQQLKEALEGAELTPEQQAKVDAVFGAVVENTTEIGKAIDNDPTT